MSDTFKRAAYLHDNQADEPPRQKPITLAEQDCEGASRRVCRCCGKSKMMGDLQIQCDDCESDIMLLLNQLNDEQDN